MLRLKRERDLDFIPMQLRFVCVSHSLLGPLRVRSLRVVCCVCVRHFIAVVCSVEVLDVARFQNYIPLKTISTELSKCVLYVYCMCVCN